MAPKPDSDTNVDTADNQGSPFTKVLDRAIKYSVLIAALAYVLGLAAEEGYETNLGPRVPDSWLTSGYIFGYGAVILRVTISGPVFVVLLKFIAETFRGSK